MLCRLKEEHAAKLKPLQELNEQLLAELTAKQQDNSQIAALQDQLARATNRLELESSGRAELWQRCTALEQELQSTHDKLAVATKSLKRAEQQLGARPGCGTAKLAMSSIRPCKGTANCPQEWTAHRLRRVWLLLSTAATHQQQELTTADPATCMPADTERSSKLEQKLSSAEEKLQAEQVAHSKLQADVTLERSQAALVKVCRMWK